MGPSTITENRFRGYIMSFWLFLGAVVVLVIGIAVADKFGSIAEMKGFSKSSYFWAVFFLGIIGMLMVAALPDDTIPKTSTNSHTQQPNWFDTPSTPWTCSCGRQNQSHERSCVCGLFRPITKTNTQAPSYPSASNSKSGVWTCTCGRHHQSYETSCICGVTKASLQKNSNS